MGRVTFCRGVAVWSLIATLIINKLIYIFYTLSMGCCDSNLAYEENTIGLNPHYIPTKSEMAKIAQASPLPNTDRNSLFSIDLRLNQMIEIYETRQQIISAYSNCNIKFCQSEFENEAEAFETIKAETKQCRNHGLSSSSETFTDSDSSQGDMSQVHKTELLSNQSLHTSKMLEKKFFYINSSHYNSIKFGIWDQIDRQPLSIEQEHVIQLLQGCGRKELAIAITSVYFYQKNKTIKLVSTKDRNQQSGIRVFFNGTKRLMPMAKGLNSVEILRETQELLPRKTNLNYSFVVYYLTGWIPQIVNLELIKDKKQVFHRLIDNFKNANLIISFSSQSNQEVLFLSGTELKKQQLKFASIPTNNIISETIKKWQEVVSAYPLLNINWNPTLYGCCQKMEVTVNAIKKPRFLLRIPASKSDSEIRVVAERHVNCLEQQIQESRFELNLYNHHHWEIEGPENSEEPVRRGKSVNYKFLSDSLIFEGCEDESLYELIMEGNAISQDYEENNQFTLSFYSFVALSIRDITERRGPICLEYEAQIRPEQTGFGINSPYFPENLHFSLAVPRNHHCKVTVEFEHEDIEIALMPDVHNKKDLGLLKIEKLASEMMQSENDGDRYSILDFESHYENYILMVICYEPIHCHFTIQVKAENLFLSEVKESISLEELHFQPTILKQQQFQWNKNCSGPRRRLQTNTLPIFYPQQTFKDFFTNPFIDEFLEAGEYQFVVCSIEFEKSVEEGIHDNSSPQFFMELLNPPGLSINLLHKSEEGQKFKVILDDTFYVPFGMGFWSQPVALSKGWYRVVMPRVEQADSMGKLKIRKL